MKLALIILATLTLTAGTARAETFAFADPARVDAESTEWGRLWSEIVADKETKDREISAALTSAQQAKPAEAQTLADKYRKLMKMDSDDLLVHQKSSRATFEKHRGEVAAAIEREKHVTLILAAPAVPTPKRDLTDELIRRLNASDVAGIIAENAKLKAEKAALTKPTPPVVPPPPPPSQPTKSAAHKSK